MLEPDLPLVHSSLSQLTLYSGTSDTSPHSASTAGHSDLPPLPSSPEQRRIEDYLQDILNEADVYQDKDSQVRVRGISSQSRQRSLTSFCSQFEFSKEDQATLMTRLEDVGYKDNLQDGTVSDGDIITLQMFAISGLQQERRKFSRLAEALEEENRVLQEINRQHTERRLHILNSVVRRRGQELTKHGEFLIRLAEQNCLPGQHVAAMSVHDRM
jgi:hypothetical protein